LFTGAAERQEITLWDIRTTTAVYDLSTGNTNVTNLAWDCVRNTLYATAECDYVLRSGDYYDYRIARMPQFLIDEEIGADRDSDFEYIDEDEHDFCWPRTAFHEEDYFGYLYDAGAHVLLEYKFKENPDTKILPEYGQAWAEDRW
ncbi:hypothetical protein H0H93_012806, partial [Arthromyces matolae]